MSASDKSPRSDKSPVSDTLPVSDRLPVSEATAWYILGAGAIGCLFGAHLRRSGVPVRLLLRDDAALHVLQQAGGITIDDGIPQPIDADVIGTLPSSTLFAKLLICTKAHQTRPAIEAVRAHLAHDVTIVLLQNGMGVREELASLLPDATIFNALTTEGAWRRDRFSVVHAGRGETLLGGTVSNKAHAIAEDLARSALTVRAVDDIAQHLWTKLAINCVINPLTALHRCRNGELLNLAQIGELTRDICDEVASLAATQGVSLNSAQLQQRVLAVMQSTANNQSSMLQDVLRGQTTEIDYLNGYVVKLAESLCLGANTHRALLVAIKNLPQPVTT